MRTPVCNNNEKAFWTHKNIQLSKPLRRLLKCNDDMCEPKKDA